MGAVDLPATTSRGADYCRRPLRRGLHQSEERLQESRTLIAEQKLFEEELEELKDLPCITQDGWRVQLWVNIGLSGDITRSLDRGAEGIGCSAPKCRL